jgi:Mrp family chromosome partitioning ATPase
MGKVYDALNRAQNEADELDLFDEGPDAPDDEEEDAIRGEPAGEKFNFMRYSLGVTSLVAKVRNGNGRTAQALVRSPSRPGCELTIDPDRLDPHLVAFNSFDPHSSQEYNKLALSLVSKSAEKGFKRVLVASAREGEGRTCVTLNLACALARARQRVLVVDCDLVNPSIMRSLGLHAQIGMREAFERGMPPNAAAIAIRPFGFNVLPTIRPVDNPAELFAAPPFWKMLQSLDADYDFILFDSSSLATGGDSSLLVRFTDTTLLVIRAGYTSSAEIAKAIAPFAQDDILGVVMNRMKH